MTLPNSDASPSTAVNPDLDWSQVRETVRMLELSTAQILMALKEGEDSVGTLTASFTNMVGSVNNIATSVANLVEQSTQTEEVKTEVLSNCAEVQGSIQHTIMAFQFYDKLTQRLTHVTDALAKLSDLVADQSRLYSPHEWRSMQDAIRFRYTMKEEQEMFDALLIGATVDQALEKVSDRLHEGDIDDIELF